MTVIIFIGYLMFSWQPLADQGDVRVLDQFDRDLKWIQGQLFYKRKLWTGWVEEYYPNGQCKSESYYIRGKKSGEQYRWYYSGQLSSHRQYRFGKKTGTHMGWWENGHFKFKYQFQHGLENGQRIEWQSNGNLFRTGEYVEGQEVGKHKRWDYEGNLISNYIIRGDRRFGLIGTKPCYSVSGDSAQELIVSNNF